MVYEIIAVLIALGLTLFIETPYVYFVMKYKCVKNIIAINVFTNIFLNIMILIANESELYTLVILGILELFFIPLAEIWFYNATDMNDLTKRRIIIHTCIANFLSCGIGLLVDYLVVVYS